MKKIALSLAVIAATGAYVWGQSGAVTPDDILEPSSLIGDTKFEKLPVEKAPPTAAGAAPETGERMSPADGSNPPETRAVGPQFEEAREAPPVASPTAIAAALRRLPPPTIAAAPPVDIPVPRPRPEQRQVATIELKRREQSRLVKRVAMTVTAAAYNDGIYTGPVTNAYYGSIQLQAVIQGGRLAGIRILQYPSDRRTSIMINRQALPMLRDEVVSAQSARVDIISGATLTSEAFLRSLAGALKQART